MDNLLKLIIADGYPKSDFLDTLSNIIGWCYFVAWSISFYGQLIENYKVKNVKGIAFEFLALNLTGFLFLSAYSSAGYFKAGDNGDWPFSGEITIQDLFFAYHAVIITLLTIGQTAYYFKRGDNAGVKLWCIIVLVLLWGNTLLYILITWIFGWDCLFESEKLNILYYMGYEKLFISFIKYMPQVYLNFKRKSTVGWSILNILLDFTGGFLSFLQMLLDSLNGKDQNLVDVNIVKFILSWIAMGFDTIFMVQHYILYNPNKKTKTRQALLDEYSMPKQ